tara:strand:+ start:5417 stop:7357 length:1941 start_codon:yes stop_codon:yes gene_type:complete
MASFAAAFTKATNIIQGHNGENMLATSNSAFVDSFNKLLQSTDEFTIKDSVKSMIREYKNTKSIDTLCDIFTLAFHKRATPKKDITGTISEGEGCKKLFYIYFLELYNTFPSIVCDLAERGIIAVYGYWKDYLHIWEMINENSMSDSEKKSKYGPLILALSNGILSQRNEDIVNVRTYCSKHGFNFDFSSKAEFEEFINSREDSNDIPKISMVGKYCVRETSKFNKSCSWFISDTTNSERHISFMCRKLLSRKNKSEYTEKIDYGALKKWRIVNAKLNLVLDVPEVKFCGGIWSELKIGTIPSLCLHKNTNALLNQLKNSQINNDIGDRYPANDDRITCRNNMIEHVTSGKKINVSALLPHQIIGDAGNISSVSGFNELLMQKKWNMLLDYVRETMDATKESIVDETQRAFASGNILCCCDTSASMTWVDSAPNRPFDIGTALTAFCSSLSSVHYKNKIMTFSTYPEVIDLEETDLKMRMEKIYLAGNSGSTNYEGMHIKLIDLCKQFKVPEEELPVLVVFTDGHFDMMMQVRGTFNTAQQKVTKLWIDAGYTKVPTICYWNLAPNNSGVQSEQDRKGVLLLQGASPSNIRFVLYGEGAEETEVTETIDGETVTYKTKNIDPYTIFRKAMDQAFFDPVRTIVKRHQ